MNTSLDLDDSLTPSPQLEFLPKLLLSLLERRYLSNFDSGEWTLSLNNASARPSLREVISVGRIPDTPLSPMAAALSAWHEPGHAVLTVIHGGPDQTLGYRHRMYYGAKRLPGGCAANEFLSGQMSTLTAHFPGLVLGATQPIDEFANLAAFLRTAPALAAITGIPDVISASCDAAVERLARSIRGQQYALIGVAEPLSSAATDSVLDACLRLRTDVSSFISRQSTTTRGEGESSDVSQPLAVPDSANQIPAYLRQAAYYVQAVSGQPVLGALTIVSALVAEAHQRLPATPVLRESRSKSWSESVSNSFVDAVARTCDELLSAHVRRIQAGRGWGLWRAGLYVAAESQACLQAVGRTIRALGAGDGAAMEPLRFFPVPATLLRDAILTGGIIDLRPRESGSSHPLGHDFDTLATCLTSLELSAVLAPPRHEIPGIGVNDRGQFAVTVPIPGDLSFELGRVHDSSGEEYGPVRLTPRMLNEHLLVTGTPGSGKTNTCLHILSEAYQNFNVPFLVIEPAKAEYRQLQRRLGHHVKVLTVGDPAGIPLRLNPLTPVVGAPLLGHIDLLKAVFDASFDMHPGMPQILEQALMEVYQDRGWDLYSGTNDELAQCTDTTEAAALTPCLADLHDQIESVMQRKGYAGEVRMNLGAAVRSRLNGLMLGAKGRSLNVRRSTPDDVLFNQPTVLELQHLRDNDEKAFVIATIFMRLYQFCEVRQHQLPASRQNKLQHLTLIEEAHRLLAGGHGEAASGSRDKAVSMFTDMLAELRALGEGFMIAEQIPTKLAADTLKNTNLKIIHRLTTLGERTVAGNSINLRDDQLGPIAKLSKGLAVIHGLSASDNQPVGDAALVQMARFKADIEPGQPPDATKAEVELDWRHSGCRSCLSPCNYFHRIESVLLRDPQPDWIRRFAEATMGRMPTIAWELWSRWREDEKYDKLSVGEKYCWFIHAIRFWLQSVTSLRSTSDGNQAPITPGDRLVIERLSGGFGRLARRWLECESLDDDARETFNDVCAALQHELFDDRTPPLLGCDACRARCRMLPYVASIAGSQTSKAISQVFPRPTEAFAASPLASKNRLQKLLEAVRGIETQLVLPAGSDEAIWRRDWLYCLLTVVPLPNEPAGFREQMLSTILRANLP